MEENNKLIAEFMGISFDNSLGWRDNNMWLMQYIYDIENGNYFDTLHFHESWDWLMPVVAKIYQSTEYVDDQIPTAKAIQINVLHITNTHTDVVNYIKWYNKNK